MAASVKTFSNNNPPAFDDNDLNGLILENNNLIAIAGLILDDTDHNQTREAVAIYSSGSNFYNDSGSSNAYVLSPIGLKIAPPVYFEGMRIRFDPASLNTGPSTVNVASIGIVNLTLDGISPMYPGSMSPGKVMDFYYNGSNFQLTDPFSVFRGVTLIRTSDSASEPTTPFNIKYQTELIDTDNAADVGGANPDRITIPAWVRFARFSFASPLIGTSPSGIRIIKNDVLGVFDGTTNSGDTGISIFEGNSTAWIPVLPGDYYTVNVSGGSNIVVGNKNWFSSEFK